MRRYFQSKATAVADRLLLAFLVLLLSTAVAIANTTTDSAVSADPAQRPILVYLVSDLSIPFWQIMERGIRSRAESLGYRVETYSAGNSAKRELELAVKASRQGVAGIIVSPTTSSACVTVLQLAGAADIPVVISDIGTDGGDYVAYISSDNHAGAYQIGKVLAGAMRKRGWHDGRVGIVAIPQKRLNGQARTAGFMWAMDEAGIKGAGIEQQVDFSDEETYRLSRSLIAAEPGLRALWLQGSDKYRGALRAISDAGRQDEMILLTFDAEPEFIDLIPQGVILGAAMQQPYLMGEESVLAMHRYLRGERPTRHKRLPVLAVSADNISRLLPVIRRNVLGIETP